MNSWWEQFQEPGPCVPNAIFAINDLEQTVLVVIAAGAIELMTCDMSVEVAGLGVTGSRTTSLIDAVDQLGGASNLQTHRVDPGVPG